MKWDTSCIDWERRIVERESLITCPVLYPREAEAAMRIFCGLHLVDVAKSPTVGSVSLPWILDFASVIFGSYDATSGQRLINNYFLLVSKKNGKALALDTKVATIDGFKNVSEVSVGDYVLGDDGVPTKVIDKSPIFINHACYKVTFSTDESVVCDAGHLWVTESHKES